MAPTNEIDARVTKVLVQALGVDEGDIKPSATLQADLGAESIDFLDITFRLEREFGIKIARGELFAELILESAAEIVHDGEVTEHGLAALRAHMPFADWSELERDRRLNRIDDLFTVDLLSKYIRWKLGQGGGARADVATPDSHHFAGVLTPA
jgi:acyl carrier protein